MISIARTLGAPDTVPAGNAGAQHVEAVEPGLSVPSTLLTMCITCE
jgi:hypothetical protein